jgi:membrane protein
VAPRLQFLADVVRDFFKHDALSLAAAVAFYTALSFAPLVLLLVSVGGLLGESTKYELLGQFSQYLGPRSAQLTQSVVDAAASDAARTSAQTSAWRTVLGVGGMIFTASAVFGQLQSSLNTIWGVAATPARTGRRTHGRVWEYSISAWAWLRKRLLSMGMVLVVLFILLVSLVLSALLARLMPGADDAKAVARTVDFVVSVGVATLLFAAIFKVLPDLEIPWRSVWLGALVTSLLFNVGKLALSYYIDKAAVGKDYGEAVGGLIALLVWVYYSCVALLLGAEITQRLAPSTPGRAGAITPSSA